MGLFKKIFKPVSKVLDKIIPNEIKPALPYLAAFAPYMGGMQGIMGQGMMRRALMSGALNIGGQLSQEGSEGDINLLSAGLGALQGAMTAPGTPGIGGTTLPGQATPGATPGAAQFFREKAIGMDPGWMKSGTEMLGKSSKYLTGVGKTLTDNPLSVEGLKAAAIPFTQGTGDLMYAQGQRDLKDLANEVVEDMGGGYSDDAYRAAIRKSMEAYGATEEEILESIIAAGYRSGGRVALRGGGVMNAKRGLVDGPGGYAGESQQNRFNFDDTFSLSERLNPRDPENELIAEHMQIGKLPFNITARILELNRGGKSYEDIAEITGVDIEDITSMLEVANNPDSIDPVDREGKVDYNLFEEIVKERDQIRERPEHLSYNAKGGRVGLAFGGIGAAIDNVKQNEMAEYYKNFGNDRFVSEMFDEYSGIMSGGEGFLDKVDAEIATGKFPEPEKLKSFKNEYEDLQNKYEKIEDRYSDGFEGRGDEKTDINKLKYYEDKEKEFQKREDVFNERDAELTLNNLDASEITRTPDFQAWLKLYEAKDPRAKSHPYHEEFEDVLMTILPGRDESYMKASGAWKKNGGRINKADGGVPSVLPKGVEADYRGGGFIPIGSKERADDVPARLSENEFVMTADAVRAAGGGNVNKGAQRMYNVMNNLEARA